MAVTSLLVSSFYLVNYSGAHGNNLLSQYSEYVHKYLQTNFFVFTKSPFLDVVLNVIYRFGLIQLIVGSFFMRNISQTNSAKLPRRICYDRRGNSTGRQKKRKRQGKKVGEDNRYCVCNNMFSFYPLSPD